MKPGGTRCIPPGFSYFAETTLQAYLARVAIADKSAFVFTSALQSASDQIWDEDSWDANEEAKYEQAIANGETYAKKPYSFWRNVGSVVLDAVEGAGEGVVGGEVAAQIGSAALAALAGSRLSDNALTLVVRSLQGAGFGVVSTLMNSAKSLLEGNKVTARGVGAQLVSTMVIYVLASYYGDLAAAGGGESAGETDSQTGAAASVQEKYDTAREFFTDEELSDPKSLREAYHALAKQYGVAAQRGDETALEMMKEVNNAHDAAKAICGLNILTEYQSQKTSGAPTAQTEQKAVQLVNDITADAGAEPSAGAMTVSPNPAKTVAARGFETAEVPGPLNTGKGRFVLNLLTDPQIRAAIDNAWKTGYSNGEPLSLPEVASCLTKIIGGNGGNDTTGAGNLDKIIGTGKNARFTYKHNPSNNPKVLADAVEDPKAIYGYRPNKEGSLKAFADGDWSNPDYVEKARQKRIAYHQRNEARVFDLISGMRNQGCSEDQTVRAIVEFRNQSRLSSYLDAKGNIIDQEGYAQALAHCKTYEQLIAEGKTNEDIIRSPTRGNPGMDASTGLYDDYYDQYTGEK